MRVRAWSTSANLGPGYDIMGIAIDAFSDVVEIELVSGGPDAVVTEVKGPYAKSVPLGRRNSAAAAARAALKAAEQHLTARIKLWKGVPPGRGLGSSGASSAAAVRAVDLELGGVLSEGDLVRAAAEGEREASGSPHPDNVAPSLFGGLVVIGRRIVKLDPDVRFVLSVPWTPIPERKTEKMRSLVPKSVNIEEMVRHYSHLASLLLGLATGDLRLAGEGMSYSLVDESRSKLIPGYKEVRDMAMRSGALGVSISGAGPSMLFLCEECDRVVEEVRRAYKGLGIPATVMKVAPAGGADEI